MEKTIENLKSEIANIAAETVRSEHLSVVTSLLTAAVERLGLHIQSVATPQTGAQAAPTQASPAPAA